MTQRKLLDCGCELSDEGIYCDQDQRFTFKFCEYHRGTLKTEREIHYHKNFIRDYYYKDNKSETSLWCSLDEHEKCVKELAKYGRAANCNCDCHT